MAGLDFMALARGELMAQQMNQSDALHARKLAQADFGLMRDQAAFDLAYPSAQLQQDQFIAKNAGEMQAFAELGGIISGAAAKAQALYPNDPVARMNEQNRLISEAQQNSLRDTTATGGAAGTHYLLSKLQQSNWLRNLNSGDSVAQAQIANTGIGTSPLQVDWTQNVRNAANAPVQDANFLAANGIRKDPTQGYWRGNQYIPTDANLQQTLAALVAGPDAQMNNLAQLAQLEQAGRQRLNDQFSATGYHNNDQTPGQGNFINREGTSVVAYNDPMAGYDLKLIQARVGSQQANEQAIANERARMAAFPLAYPGASATTTPTATGAGTPSSTVAKPGPSVDRVAPTATLPNPTTPAQAVQNFETLKAATMVAPDANVNRTNFGLGVLGTQPSVDSWAQPGFPLGMVGFGNAAYGPGASKPFMGPPAPRIPATAIPSPYGQQIRDIQSKIDSLSAWYKQPFQNQQEQQRTTAAIAQLEQQRQSLLDQHNNYANQMRNTVVNIRNTPPNMPVSLQPGIQYPQEVLDYAAMLNRIGR